MRRLAFWPLSISLTSSSPRCFGLASPPASAALISCSLAGPPVARYDSAAESSVEVEQPVVLRRAVDLVRRERPAVDLGSELLDERAGAGLPRVRVRARSESGGAGLGRFGERGRGRGVLLRHDGVDALRVIQGETRLAGVGREIVVGRG
jgi:hypothetical protein